MMEKLLLGDLVEAEAYTVDNAKVTGILINRSKVRLYDNYKVIYKIFCNGRIGYFDARHWDFKVVQSNKK